MQFRKLFYAQFALLAVVGAAHVLAVTYSLYWRYLWLDIPVHFLGGAWIAVLFAWILYEMRNKTVGLPYTLIVTLAVGIGWEFFELFIGIPYEARHARDTVIDICMDLSGGAAGYLIAKQLMFRA